MMNKDNLMLDAARIPTSEPKRIVLRSPSIFYAAKHEKEQRALYAPCTCGSGKKQKFCCGRPK